MNRVSARYIDCVCKLSLSNKAIPRDRQISRRYILICVYYSWALQCVIVRSFIYTSNIIKHRGVSLIWVFIQSLTKPGMCPSWWSTWCHHLHTIQLQWLATDSIFFRDFFTSQNNYPSVTLEWKTENWSVMADSFNKKQTYLQGVLTGHGIF